MRVKPFELKALVALFAVTGLCASTHSEESGCAATAHIIAMAKTKSLPDLIFRKQVAGNSYRTQVVFAARMLELDPQNKHAAELLLSLFPESDKDPHYQLWLNLDGLDQCKSGGFSESDLKPLFRLEYNLPRELAKAVLLIPQKTPEYVAFALFSLLPDSDYTIQMQKVCHQRHQTFTNAVNMLSADDKSWFLSRVFDPEKCRAIFLPEQ
jgi:hypothetical protein